MHKKITIERIVNALHYRLYYSLYVPILEYCYPMYAERTIVRLRKQNDKIKVLFVIAELSAWKTELLYLKMKKNERFEPLIGITESLEVPGSKSQLIQYMETRCYDYVDLDIENRDIYDYTPDLLCYYKPYEGSCPQKHSFLKHIKSPCLFVNYSLTLQKTEAGLNQIMHNMAWKIFDENILVSEARKNVAHNKGRNCIITGVPVQDELLLPKENYISHWKPLKERKKIIYAPHHSLRGTNIGGVDFSTFIEFGEFILSMAKKYNKETQWVFKPHPTLYPKLLKLWPKNKVDAYYHEWEILENGQYENGQYMDLFKYSDAMIHDCGSFVMEYLYTNKPVMFLMHRSPEEHLKNQNDFGAKAFNVHSHGYNERDIESFILSVINGADPKKQEREDFYNNYLLPPNGQTACDNIIDAILGQGAYKDVK